MNVRALSGHEEFAEAVRLQKIIWGFDDLELLPVRFFVVASRIGGQTFGAFDGSRMAGFLLAIPGTKKDSGMPYLHSHMLGVLSDYRNAGVGRMLKLAQREDALARGISLIEWSFDPFDAKNAYFNLDRLGAIVRNYVPNMYGARTSMLDGDLPTDRCIAEWWIAEDVHAKTPIAARVPLPSPKTLESQEALGRELQQHFDAGLAVTGFERSGETGTYLLSPWLSK
ncbi:MAG: GCN5-related N-acetyltransferase [Bryobacterales bacterium]|nr:GCN5-related N-acetyltransferase [Bryobacterales bacterium]